MKCPYCGNIDTRVIDSRPAEENAAIRRRRQCDVCKKRFTTYEKVESTVPLIVIKKDKSREVFDRGKIERGIVASCQKRQISLDQIKAIVDEIESKLLSQEEREVSTVLIGEMVMERLEKLDPVAYVRFASVYREFKDVNTFMDELKKFLQ